MQKGENSEKISPKIFIWAGIVIIAIFFTSIIFTAVDMIEYRYSRIVTYSTVVMAVSLYIIYAILDQKHLILDVPQKEQVKYLIAVTLVVTLLEVLVFLCVML
jgi:ABC-type transport system involved in cytochrome c biogenesis permease subunit